MKEDITNDTHQKMDMSHRRAVLVVPQRHVKAVKTALELFGKLDRTKRITMDLSSAGEDDCDTSLRSQSFDIMLTGLKKGQRMRLATTIPCPSSGHSTPPNQDILSTKTKILNELGLASLHEDVTISYDTPSPTTTPQMHKNPLHRALQDALDSFANDILTSLSFTTEDLIDSFPEGYSIYKPMLLLPHNAFASPPWPTLLATYPPTHPHLQSIWKHIAHATSTTHIAINSPIPLQTVTNATENVLRSPINISPLLGSFGPLPTPLTISNPTRKDFDAALWVSATQNGIRQTWAPLYTMFSRGNIREKTRIFHLPGITRDSSAVDMYAGIGYFAFSYKKAGVGKVLCFELNPWSVEGLRRGAEMNGWSCKIMKEEDVPVGWGGKFGEEDVDVDFLIFQMSNEHALDMFSRLRTTILPIRHVNLGLLPDARATWRDAVKLVDAEEGGFVRVHENVGVGEIEERKDEVERVCQEYLDEHDGRAKWKVEVEHVERVKMYAPGVVHCVFDLHVQGSPDVSFE
ncbi:hypothetical protein CC86DRAFT_185553 [Ophiobolus disseminans]|uniref:tRNA(Phe) (4-demethylwyosine(37)-C(7)) aminocarboxypropyltransferase n=1 Tax=Ophiobolus disseminans TaxID=1469910 RepID=A0A6A7A8U8_9PLEO|nr:hypothetical protein CC86DRAFT_185553 [Ophiobolus disseminans]